jgi:hypothetical protein
VQRPLDQRFAHGYTLTANDVVELKSHLARRDRWIELYQKMELDINGLTSGLERELLALKQTARIPTTGYIRQEGPASGFHYDLWAGPSLRVQLTAIEPIVKLELKGFRPEGSGKGRVTVLVNGEEAGAGEVSAGQFSVGCGLPKRVEGAFDLELRFAGAPAPKSAGDERELSFMLVELRAMHPLITVFRQRRNRP